MVSHTYIPRRDERKPDPDEPWRYVCPDCDSQVQGCTTMVDRYECGQCRSTFDFDELWDQKREAPARGSIR